MRNPNKGKGKQAQWLRDHANHADPKCLIWPFYRLPNGYGQLGYLGRMRYAHRMMCELAHGEPPTTKHEAAHKCGNGHQGCVNPKHLAWKTKAENRRESTSHGKGARNPYGTRGKLTDTDVAEIRASKGKMSNVEMAEKYGVSWTTINSILNGHHRARPPLFPHWKEEEDGKLRAALSSGLNFGETARLLGKSHNSVAARARRIGLQTNFDPHAPRGPKQPRPST